MGKYTIATPPKKKKNVAKHVIAAALKSSSQSSSSSSPFQSPPPPPPSKPSSHSAAIVKDPSTAHSYLTLWSTSRKSWKFNKSTQSWLIRHMYDAGLVSKDCFGLLVEYLKGLPEGRKRDIVEHAGGIVKAYRVWEEKGGKVEDDVGEGEGFEGLDGKGKRKVFKRARIVFRELG